MAVVLQYPKHEGIPPEREYYVARRPDPPARRSRRRRRLSLLSLLLALLLFGGGFLMGKASAVSQASAGGSSGIPVTGLYTADLGGIIPEKPEAKGASSGTPGEAEWALLLVNGEHPLPEDFTVPELTQLKNGHAIDSRAMSAILGHSRSRYAQSQAVRSRYTRS